MYCVYLTIYHGNKMPSFYIGSTSVDKINTGYHGSVSSKMWKEIWESEIKDNPHLFESKIICLHETRQEALDKEYKLHKQLDVVKNPLYINQSLAKKNGFFGMDVSGELNPNHGVTMPEEQRQLLSIAHTGKPLSVETRKKISVSTSGANNPMYGISLVVSAETRKLISIATTGRKDSEETKKKKSIVNAGANNSMYGKPNISLVKRNKANVGKIWINNEIEHKYEFIEIVPDGWKRGMLPLKRKSENPK